jgi:hypothetical protein
MSDSHDMKDMNMKQTSFTLSSPSTRSMTSTPDSTPYATPRRSPVPKDLVSSPKEPAPLPMPIRRGLYGGRRGMSSSTLSSAMNYPQPRRWDASPASTGFGNRISQRPLKRPPVPSAATHTSEARQAARDDAALARQRARRAALDALVVARRQPSAEAKAGLRDALCEQMTRSPHSAHSHRARTAPMDAANPSELDGMREARRDALMLVSSDARWAGASLDLGADDAAAARRVWCRAAAQTNRQMAAARCEALSREKRQSIADDAARAVEARSIDDWGRCAR